MFSNLVREPWIDPSSVTTGSTVTNKFVDDIGCYKDQFSHGLVLGHAMFHRNIIK